VRRGRKTTRSQGGVVRWGTEELGKPHAEDDVSRNEKRCERTERGFGKALWEKFARTSMKL